MTEQDIAAIIKKKEGAAVNDVGSGNANGIGVDNQQQQQQQNIATITINLPMKKPHKLTNSVAKEINL